MWKEYKRFAQIFLILACGYAAGSIDANRKFNKIAKPEIAKCNCVSYKQYSYLQAKYDYNVDKLNLAKPKDTARLQDSVDKYTKLLNF